MLRAGRRIGDVGAVELAQQLRRRARSPARRSPIETFRVSAGALAASARRIARLGEQRLRLAVVDDVLDLVGGEVPVDRRQPVAAAQAARQHLDELGAVAAEQRDRVAFLQAALAQQPHDLVGRLVDLAEGPRPDRVVDGDLVAASPRPRGCGSCPWRPPRTGAAIYPTLHGIRHPSSSRAALCRDVTADHAKAGGRFKIQRIMATSIHACGRVRQALRHAVHTHGRR